MSGGSRHVAAHPERLAGLLEPVVSAAGLELESVRVGRAGRRSLLRVVVDAEQGVSLDDIALVSRAVAAKVDAGDLMGPGPYTLEVSSPGAERPLTEPRHWRRAAGRRVRVPLAGRARAGDTPKGPAAVEGRVLTASETGVVLDVAGQRREFSYAELGPGKILLEFGHAAADADGGDSDGH